LINNSGTTVRSVSKTGAGTLVLDGDNSSTLGRIQLGSAVTTNGGTLRISNGGALGTNEMYFNYGTLDATAPVTIGSSFFGALSGGFSIGGREATRARITGSDVDVAGNVTAYSTVGTGDIVLEVNNRTTFSGAATLATTAGMTGFKVAGSGTLRLTGDMVGLTAPVNVAESATLSVETSLAASSLVSVAGTATLTGNSSVGPLAINAGGRLAPGLGGVGTLNAGNTTFNSGGNYTVQVSDATGGAGTGWDFLNVSGSLTIASTEASPFNINLWSLAGSTSGSAANFVPGDSYTWNIATASGGVSGFAGAKFAINTAAINGSDGFANALAGGSFKATNTGNDLNVVFTPFSAGTTLTWFGNGVAAGGSGTWSALGSAWSDGSTVGTWDPSRTALFNSTSGTVTVAGGGIAANRGLQFSTTGYRVTGGAITLGGTSADTNAISVALSSTATIDSVLAGSSGVAKTGFGTLVLTGSNSFSGGTQVREGTLQVGAGGATGSLPGDVSIDNGATLAFNKSSNDTVSAALSGAGAVVQKGSGDLRLTGANSGLSGGVRAEAGSVTVGASGALGTGATTVSAGSLYVESGVTNAAPILVQSTADVTPFTALYWDFGSGTTPSAQPLSGVPAGLTVGDLTRINTGTTDPLLSTTSQSSGYAGASGSYNAGLVAGRTLTVISGSTPAFEFALTPQAGSRVDVTSVSFGSRSTTTGPWSYELRSSADGYTAAVATWTSTGTAGYADSTWRLLSGSSFAVGSGDGATVTYRLFGIGNTGTGAPPSAVNWRIDDLTLGGRMVTGSGASIAIGTQSSSGTALFTGQMTLERTVPLTAPAGGTARFEGAIVDGIGANGVLKVGGGMVILAGNNTYRGTTTVAEGTLQVTGATGGSPFAVLAGATLAGDGTVGAITTTAGGTLSPGVGIGTLSAGSTALAGGAALNWQLYNAGGASPAGNWDLLGVTGGITVNATSGSPFAINLQSASDSTGTPGSAVNFDPTVPGRWTFATTTSGITGFDSTKFTLSTAGFTNTLSGGTFSVGLSLDSLGLDVIFTPSSAFSSLVWYGDDETAGGKGAWTDLNVNWFNESTSTVTAWNPARTALFNTVGGEVTIGPGGIAAASGLTFAASDYVVGGGVLTLSGTSLAANTVTVDPGISTTITAPVAGSAGMTKAGAGTLVLGGSNTLTGGVTLAGGTLQIGAGGTGGTLATDVALVVGTTLAFNRADTSTFAGAVSGSGGLAKSGAGTLVLTGSSSYSGGTTVSEGTVVVGDGATAGSILSTGNLDLAAGTVLAFDRSDAVAFNGAVAGAGTLAQRGGGVLTLSRTGSTNAYGSAFTLRAEDGTIDLFRNDATLVGILGPGNTVELAGGTLQLSSNSGEETKFQGAAIDVQQSSVLAILRTGTTPTNHTTTGFSAPITVRNGSTLTFDYRGAIGSSGTFTAKGTTTYSSGVTLASNATFAVTNSAGGTAEVIFSGDVVESGGSFGLTKTGDQRLTLTGSANTYSGATTVAVGTLALGSNALLPNSPSITIAAGATLDVSAKASGYAVAVGQTVGAGCEPRHALGDAGRHVGQRRQLQLGDRGRRRHGGQPQRLGSRQRGRRAHDRGQLVEPVCAQSLDPVGGHHERRGDQFRRHAAVHVEDRLGGRWHHGLRGRCLHDQHGARQRHRRLCQLARRRQLQRGAERQRPQPRVHAGLDAWRGARVVWRRADARKGWHVDGRGQPLVQRIDRRPLEPVVPWSVRRRGRHGRHPGRRRDGLGRPRVHRRRLHRHRADPHAWRHDHSRQRDQRRHFHDRHTLGAGAGDARPAEDGRRQPRSRRGRHGSGRPRCGGGCRRHRCGRHGRLRGRQHLGRGGRAARLRPVRRHDVCRRSCGSRRRRAARHRHAPALGLRRAHRQHDRPLRQAIARKPERAGVEPDHRRRGCDARDGASGVGRGADAHQRRPGGRGVRRAHRRQRAHGRGPEGPDRGRAERGRVGRRDGNHVERGGRDGGPRRGLDRQR
jgi:autotransporter-associated beta strand protein